MFTRLFPHKNLNKNPRGARLNNRNNIAPVRSFLSGQKYSLSPVSCLTHAPAYKIVFSACACVFNGQKAAAAANV